MTQELLVGGLFNAAVGIAIYYGVTRRETGRDEKVTRLQARVDDFERQDLAELHTAASDNASKRKEIYQRMERELLSKEQHSEMEKARISACLATHERDKEWRDVLVRRLDGHTAQLTELTQQVSGVTSVVRLIADRMNISLD